MELTIKIKDINDNIPVFEKIECNGHVPRNVPLGSEIYTINAIDFDTGSVITYRFVPGSSSETGNNDPCFNLDATSGILTLSCDLNQQNFDEKILNITATDGKYYAEPMALHFFLVDMKRSLPPNRNFLEGVGSFSCKDTGASRKLSDMISLAERNNRIEENDFLMMPTR